MFSNNVALVLQKLVIEKMPIQSLKNGVRKGTTKIKKKKKKKKIKIKKSLSPKFTSSVSRVKRQLLMQHEEPRIVPI